MKYLLALLTLSIPCLSFANMASPIREGTYSSAAISSRDIDILKEKLFLKIDKDFRTASYVIEYFIRTDNAGKQIPLLFYAMDYRGDFKVWVDGQEIKLSEAPEILSFSGTPFEKFSNSFDGTQQDQLMTQITWGEYLTYSYSLNELKYFEADLSKGEHTIRVEYAADAWRDVSDWVTKYSFRYSLSPAKHWKSFGGLEIIIDASAVASAFTTNIGPPENGKTESVATWNFGKLPADYLLIDYIPKINSTAQFFLAMSPEGIALMAGIVMVILHFFGIRAFRKRNPDRKYSWVVIVGSIVLPFLILTTAMLSYDLIDALIGDDAGRYHGYVFLVFLFYPVLVPVYLLVMWLLDRMLKRLLRSRGN